MDHASKALNQRNSSSFKDHDNLPYKMLSNHPEMKTAILKKNGNNKTPSEKLSRSGILQGQATGKEKQNNRRVF